MAVKKKAKKKSKKKVAKKAAKKSATKKPAQGKATKSPLTRAQIKMLKELEEVTEFRYRAERFDKIKIMELYSDLVWVVGDRELAEEVYGKARLHHLIACISKTFLAKKSAKKKPAKGKATKSPLTKRQIEILPHLPFGPQLKELEKVLGYRIPADVGIEVAERFEKVSGTDKIKIMGLHSNPHRLMDLAKYLAEAGDTEWAKEVYEEVDDKARVSFLNALRESGLTPFLAGWTSIPWTSIHTFTGLKTVAPVARRRYFGDLLNLANSLCKTLGDKKWAKKVYKKAEEIAEDDENATLSKEIYNYLDDREWGRKVYYKSPRSMQLWR